MDKFKLGDVVRVINKKLTYYWCNVGTVRYINRKGQYHLVGKNCNAIFNGSDLKKL